MKNILWFILIVGIIIWIAPVLLMITLVALSAIDSIFNTTPGWSVGILVIIIIIGLVRLCFEKK